MAAVDPFVVVGSGPAGLAAVQAFREAEPDRPAVLITADRHRPYARPPLTKDFLTGDSSLEELWLVETDWFDEHNVRLQVAQEVVGVDRRTRRVALVDGTTQPFGPLVLATGSRARPLSVPGGDDPEVILVRDLDSGIRLRDLANTRSRVAVIGSGFIGCEAAASLCGRGLDVLLLTRESVPHEKRLGVDAGRRVAQSLGDAGVELRTEVSIERLERDRGGWRVGLGDGSEVRVDAVVSGSGVEPNVELAKAAGLDLCDGAVVTDSGMQTSASAVYAVGDIAYAEHGLLGRHLRVEHWGDAEEQGRVAGRQAAGVASVWQEVPGFWSTIGEETLMYASWGEGFDDYRVVPGSDRQNTADSWTVWYRSGDQLCGVLAVGDEDAYERGRQQLRDRVRFDEAG